MRLILLDCQPSFLVWVGPLKQEKLPSTAGHERNKDNGAVWIILKTVDGVVSLYSSHGAFDATGCDVILIEGELDQVQHTSPAGKYDTESELLARGTLHNRRE